MRVVKVKLEGLNGPTVYRNVDAAVDELRTQIEFGLAEGDDTPIAVTFDDLSEEEYHALPEFVGY